MFSLVTKEEWRCRADGIATFKTPTMQHGTLQNEDILHEEYWPKMLLYAPDELFFIFDQVKRQRGEMRGSLWPMKYCASWCCDAPSDEVGRRSHMACQMPCPC